MDPPFAFVKAACTLLVLCAFIVLPASGEAQGPIPDGLPSKGYQCVRVPSELQLFHKIFD
jgi:hypothetical protein